MPFKKLHPEVKEVLEDLEISTPTPFQIASIPVIKSGANLFCIAPLNSGKTTTLILTTLHKLKCREEGSAPRAVILVDTNDNAIELYNQFLKYTRQTSLRVYLGDEKQHIELLKSEIFEGIDILIATADNFKKLFILEGVNTSQLKMIAVDDAVFLNKTNAHTALMLVTQSIKKCQYVIYAEKMYPYLKRLEDHFMTHARIVSI